jgi:hypothetical protein
VTGIHALSGNRLLVLLRSSFGLDTLHIDLDDNFVTDDHPAVIQRRAKVDIEVPPIDLPRASNRHECTGGVFRDTDPFI